MHRLVKFVFVFGQFDEPNEPQLGHWVETFLLNKLNQNLLRHVFNAQYTQRDEKRRSNKKQ